MILLVGHYHEASPERAHEYEQCLWLNCKNAAIERVFVFLEDEEPIGVEHANLELVPHGGRLRYNDLFAYAGLYIREQVCIIANADIYFDRTLDLVQRFDLAGKFLCLARWEIDTNSHLVKPAQSWSQDAWIFQTPIPRINADFELGRMKCDNRIAFEAREAGLQLLNPSHTVRAIHLHASNVRNYNEAHYLKGPGAWVPPHELGSEPPLVELRDDSKHPLGFNPYTPLQNGLLPIVNLNRKF
jgi:hypothetical protein